MNSRWSIHNAMACILAAMTPFMAAAGKTGYEIVRSSVGGGSTTTSVDGEYQISSTIGQPHAGVLTGDEYGITGGFWYEIPTGDCTADGYVDYFEHEQFSGCLTGPGAGEQFEECLCFDIDRNGSIDLLDYASVQAAFTGP